MSDPARPSAPARPSGAARRPVPEPDASSAQFWEACARHELLIQRCAECDTFRHPPRPMCPACQSFAHTFVPASGRARVWSWIVAHPPLLPAFAERAPYVVAVVELDEGVRMVGELLGTTAETATGPAETATGPAETATGPAPGPAGAAPAAGARVTVEFEDIEDGVALPQWRLDDR